MNRDFLLAVSSRDLKDHGCAVWVDLHCTAALGPRNSPTLYVGHFLAFATPDKAQYVIRKYGLHLFPPLLPHEERKTNQPSDLSGGGLELSYLISTKNAQDLHPI
jgi:hypothetical protein